MLTVLMVTAVLAAAGAGAGACAGSKAAGPSGDPDKVVAAAPDRTVAGGRARVAAATPEATATGTVDLSSGQARVTLDPPARPHALLRDPRLAVDLVRGALNVEFYGGNEVRGVSTFRYEIDVDPELARTEAPADRGDAVAAFSELLRGPTFYADVWVDAAGRLRRVQLPIDLNDARPRGRSRDVPDVVTVDLFDFASEPAS